MHNLLVYTYIEQLVVVSLMEVGVGMLLLAEVEGAAAAAAEHGQVQCLGEEEELSCHPLKYTIDTLICYLTFLLVA